MRGKGRRGSVLGGVAVCIACLTGLVASPAAASPASRDLIRAGAAELAAQHYDAALAKFRAAEQADPKDGDAYFFEGATLNRLSQSPLALLRLRRAADLGTTNPDLRFETGWSLVYLGQDEPAVRMLEAYEKAHPGRGLTSELLGRAYLDLRQFDKAKPKFEEAMARDPALRANALYYLTMIDAARQDRAATDGDLQRLMSDAPEAPISQTLREQFAASQQPAKPWHVTLTQGIGYNTNVIALGAMTALPPNISHKASAFFETTLDAGYDIRLSQADSVSLGYGLDALIYDRLASFNLWDNDFRLDYRHSFRSDLVGTLRVNDEYTLLAGRSFRNQLGLRPALLYRINEWLAVEGAYDLAFADYDFPAIHTQNRSGYDQTVAGNAYLSWPGTDWHGVAGYYFSANTTSGSEFTSQSNGILIGATHPLWFGVTAGAQITFNHDYYTHGNSFNTLHRADDVTHLTLQMQRPIIGPVGGYVRYEYLNDTSNVSFYRFQQNVISAGVTASF